MGEDCVINCIQFFALRGEISIVGGYFKRSSMCFSATASFGASIVLTGIGVASLKQVKEPAQYPFASIPLIFGVQQLYGFPRRIANGLHFNIQPHMDF